MYTLRLGSIHLYPMLAGERDIVYAYVYGYGILPEMERKIGVRVRRRRRLGITSISSWKSVIWRGIISCFWREGERERKREREIGEHGRASFAAGVVVNTSHVYAFFYLVSLTRHEYICSSSISC